MFETAMVSEGPQTKRMWTTCLGFTGQALLIGGMLVAPMIWPQALPNLLRVVSISAPPAPPPRPFDPGPRFMPTATAAILRPNRPFYVPPRVPDSVPTFNDIESAAPATQLATSGSVGPATGPGGTEGIPGGVGPSVSRPTPPVPTPPTVTTKSPDPKPPRVTVMQMAEPIQRVNPIYPELAKRARIYGKVELMGVLGTDGRIHELKVMSGHPLLVKAAADAVLQWVYRPTILNGQAVEVSAPITVNFILTN